MNERLARVRELAERRLDRAAFDGYVRAPMTAEEREEIASLVRWFRRRYPTPLQRLGAARKAAFRARQLAKAAG